MTWGDWQNSRKVRRLIREKSDQVDTGVWDANFLLKCIQQECKPDLDGCLSTYWNRLPEFGLPGEAERQRAQIEFLVSRSLMNCGRSKCEYRESEGLDRLMGGCEGCSRRFYVLKNGGDARPRIRRFIGQTTERLLVSAVMDPVTNPVLGKVADVQISDEVLRGSTLYVIAQEIGWLSEGMAHRLSFDLADLLVNILGINEDKGSANTASFGSGQWVLNALFEYVCKRPKQLLKADVPFGWPQFKEDWEALGDILCRTYVGKFRR